MLTLSEQAWPEKTDNTTLLASIDSVEHQASKPQVLNAQAQEIQATEAQTETLSTELPPSVSVQNLALATTYIFQRLIGVKTEPAWLGSQSDAACNGDRKAICLERVNGFLPSLHLTQSPKTAQAEDDFDHLRWTMTPESFSALKRAAVDKRTLKIVELLEDFSALAWVDLEAPLEETIETLFSEEDGLNKNDKYVVFASILPLLERHALEAQSTVRIKKLRQVRQTIERYLPDAKCDIICHYDSYGDDVLRFERNELWLNLEELLLPQGFAPRLQIVEVTSQASHDQTDPKLQADKLRCYAAPAYDDGLNALFAPQHVEDKLEALRLSLFSRDSDAIDESLLELVEIFESFKNHHGVLAPPNDHWQEAPIDAWQCTLQCLSMELIEQHRMVAALYLDQAIQGVFWGSDFYARLSQWKQCAGKIPAKFRRNYDDIESLRGSEIRWVQKNFAPKHKRGLRRAFSAWTKRVPKDTQLYRSLIASFTSFSQGDLGSASRLGQGISDKRPLRHNPQIHAYAFVLNALEDRIPDAPALELFAASLDDKALNHAYLSFAISAPYLSSSHKMQITDVVRTKPASRAPHGAARFFEAYQTELLSPFKPKDRAGLLHWLDLQLHKREAPVQSQIRREYWLLELVSAKDWSGVEKLAQYIQNDAQATPFYRQLFAEVAHIAASQSQTHVTDIAFEAAKDRSKAFDQCQADALDAAKDGGKDSALIYLESLPKCLKSIELSRRIHLLSKPSML